MPGIELSVIPRIDISTRVTDGKEGVGFDDDTKRVRREQREGCFRVLGSSVLKTGRHVITGY